MKGENHGKVMLVFSQHHTLTSDHAVWETNTSILKEVACTVCIANQPHESVKYPSCFVHLIQCSNIHQCIWYILLSQRKFSNGMFSRWTSCNCCATQHNCCHILFQLLETHKNSPSLLYENGANTTWEMVNKVEKQACEHQKYSLWLHSAPAWDCRNPL